MKIHYDLDKLRTILQDLSVLTGISMTVLDANRQPLIRNVPELDYCAAIQKQNGPEPCRCSDDALLDRCEKSRTLESHTCHAGLYDLAMPVIKQDMIVGFLVMGRIRSPMSRPFVADPELDRLYQQIPYFSQEKLQSLIDLMPRILFESAIEIAPDHLIRQAQQYIQTHLNRSITIAQLCAALQISKNRLYDLFHTHLGCTVSQYIIGLRIQKACQLLRQTDEPVYRIAELTGIENYTYFCRLFKKHTGLSPTAYRCAPSASQVK